MADSDEKMAALCVCCGESKSKFYRNALFIIGTIRGVTSGERFKKNFYCGVYEVISLGKWPSSYDCIVPLADQGMGGIGIGDPLPVSKKIF